MGTRAGIGAGVSLLLAAFLISSGALADFTDDVPPAIKGEVQGSGKEPAPSKASGTKGTPSGGESQKKASETTGTPTGTPSGTPQNAPASTAPESPSAQSSSAGKPASGSLMTDDLTKHNSEAPINFSGKVIKGLRSQGRLDLEGDVVITQADARLLSDRATVLSEPVTNRTKKAIARGNVKFSKQSTPQTPPLKAEADEMEYLVAERQVLMTGKPKVWRGNELIQGKEIVLELDTGAVIIKEARGILEPNNVPKKK